jgi:hypothetical protein
MTTRFTPIPCEDAMLAYIAVTRAKQVPDDGGLAWIHDAVYKPAAATRTNAVQPTESPPSAMVTTRDAVASAMPSSRVVEL